MRSALSKASAAAAAREAWLKAKPTVFTVLRAAFGVALCLGILVKGAINGSGAFGVPIYIYIYRYLYVYIYILY